MAVRIDVHAIARSLSCLMVRAFISAHVTERVVPRLWRRYGLRT